MCIGVCGSMCVCVCVQTCVSDVCVVVCAYAYVCVAVCVLCARMDLGVILWIRALQCYNVHPVQKTTVISISQAVKVQQAIQSAYS